MGLKRCEHGHIFNDELDTMCPLCHENALKREEIFYFDECGNITDRDSAVRFVVRVTENGELVEESWGSVSRKAENEGTAPLSVAPENFDPLVGWLVCIEGRERGRDYHLYTGRNFIGRSEKSEIMILDDLITNENHASVIYDPKSLRFIVMPGESRHMTVNGEELNAPRDLKDGDMIVCGKTKLCFVAFCKKGRIWEG